jgi:polyisoprenoid-binding protein YceI
MKVQHVAAAFALAGSLVFTVGLSLGFSPMQQPAAAAPSGQAAQAFQVDPVHSSVMFRIEHMGVCNFYGAFTDVSGSYTLDETPSFNFTVKADSVDTRSEARDKHLKSPDFFNAVEFPTITFKSTSAQKSGDNWKVTGDLTLHGVTKPVTAELKTWQPKDTRQGFRSGFETHFTIKRTDFGMDTYVAEGGLGDEVTVLFAAEGAVAK